MYLLYHKNVKNKYFFLNSLKKCKDMLLYNGWTM